MTFNELEQKANDLFVAYKSAQSAVERTHKALDENNAEYEMLLDQSRLY